jgi:hypothetical protein
MEDYKVFVFNGYEIKLTYSDHKYWVKNLLTGEVTSQNLIHSVTELANRTNKFNAKNAIVSMKPETREKYGDMTDSQITKSWINFGLFSARQGTLLHSTVEQMLRTGEIPPIPAPILPPSDIKFDGSLDIVKKEHLFELSNYLKKQKIIPIYIEIAVYDHIHNICGCIDAVFRNIETNELSIWDWKRKKTTADTNQIRLQLNLYKYIFELCGQKISKLYVCNIYPTNNGIEITEIPIDEESVVKVLREPEE